MERIKVLVVLVVVVVVVMMMMMMMMMLTTTYLAVCVKLRMIGIEIIFYSNRKLGQILRPLNWYIILSNFFLYFCIY
jgi:hypothetical protein